MLNGMNVPQAFSQTTQHTGPEQLGDTSADPIQGVLPKLIEATNRVLIASGHYDMDIITNGMLLSIQNMTWNGALGFQNRPSVPIVVQTPDLLYAQAYSKSGLNGVDGPQGTVGIQHYDLVYFLCTNFRMMLTFIKRRGLMWAETF
jgi:carboxypeptidase D